MQVQNISRNNVKFTGLMKNKLLLRGLENVAEHGTSFAAGTSLFMSLTVRPLAIMATPDTEKENKQYASASSISSGITKFAIVEAVALPIENAVKKIDNNPKKYLKPETIKNLQDNTKPLVESKSYKFAAQILKLGAGFLTAVPKSMLTIAFIPLLMDKLFNLKKPVPDKKVISGDVTFTGNLTEKAAKGAAKFIDNSFVQRFAKKYKDNDRDAAKHIMACTDILLTSSYAYQTNKSDRIKENRKKALIYNNILSTAATLAAGYTVDGVLAKQTYRFVDKFSRINKFDPKLHKYIEGLNIVRPAIIFAGVYYGLLPIFSTYFAEKIDKYIEERNKA